MSTTTTGTAEHPVVTALHAAGAALAECDRRIAAFKKEHMANVNGQQSFVSDRITKRRELDDELRRLLRARDQVWRQHQHRMKEWAQIKVGGAE